MEVWLIYFIKNNYEKALTDCLSKHIKGFEDHKIKGGSCWKYDSEKEYIEVEIKELNN